MKNLENTSLNSTNCVLIGFMGSGKSTIARELHQLSGRFALDSDCVIAYNENLSINEIFAQKGESYFRTLEARFCTFIAQYLKGAIIATGGGMPISCNVQSMGRVFYLHLEFEEILARLNSEEIHSRPLFKNPDLALALYASRLNAYKNNAHHIINANATPSTIAQEILKQL